MSITAFSAVYCHPKNKVAKSVANGRDDNTACSRKLPWGVRLNPTEQRSIAQCILLSACNKRFPTRVSFRMIRSSEAMTVLWVIYLFTSVDVAHADVLFLYIYAIYTAIYMRLYCAAVLCKKAV